MSTNTAHITSVLIILMEFGFTILHYDRFGFCLITVMHYYVDDIVGSCSPNLSHADIMGLSFNSFDQLMWSSSLSKNGHGISLAIQLWCLATREV